MLPAIDTGPGGVLPSRAIVVRPLLGGRRNVEGRRPNPAVAWRSDHLLRPFAEASVLDVILRNARILDGSGNPWYRGDVGIQGDKIVAVGQVGSDDAARTVDCGGQIVSPGFIDMHT